jgi:hypothetical protein
VKLRLLRAARGGYACPPQCRPLAVRAAQAHEASPTRLFVVVGPAPGGVQPEHDSHIRSTDTTRAKPFLAAWVPLRCPRPPRVIRLSILGQEPHGPGDHA